MNRLRERKPGEIYRIVSQRPTASNCAIDYPTERLMWQYQARYRDPFHWGAFISRAGDPGPLPTS
jgi:hypothetical protein